MDSYLAEHDSPWLFHGSSKQRPLTTWAARSICVQAGHISGLSESDANKDGKLDDAELSALREVFRARRKGQADAAANKWKTTGLQQANTMGSGEAAISNCGKFRVFVLMGLQFVRRKTTDLRTAFAFHHQLTFSRLAESSLAACSKIDVSFEFDSWTAPAGLVGVVTGSGFRHGFDGILEELKWAVTYSTKRNSGRLCGRGLSGFVTFLCCGHDDIQDVFDFHVVRNLSEVIASNEER